MFLPYIAATLLALTPLDLPVASTGDHDEDAPEAIDFYGSIYEGDAFFFCLDKSGSMRGLRWFDLRDEVINAVDKLSKRSEIGAVAFAAYHSPWKLVPVWATEDNKESLRTWLYLQNVGGSTHLLSAARTTLRIAHRSRMKIRVIILVSDGLPSDPPADETLRGILVANVKRIPWNTIYLRGELGSVAGAEDFMKELSGKTGGEYRSVYD